MIQHSMCFSFFFFNDTATTEIYTLSLHDALPILFKRVSKALRHRFVAQDAEFLPPEERKLIKFQEVEGKLNRLVDSFPQRSEEHTSELQSQSNLVCRLLLEKKKNK